MGDHLARQKPSLLPCVPPLPGNHIRTIVPASSAVAAEGLPQLVRVAAQPIPAPPEHSSGDESSGGGSRGVPWERVV